MSYGCRTLANVELEVVGICLVDPTQARTILEIAEPKCFANPIIGEIIGLVAEMVDAGKSVALVDLYVAARDRHILPPQRLFNLLYDAFENVLSVALAVDLAAAVRRAYTVRHVRAEAVAAVGRLSLARDDDLPCLVAETGDYLKALAAEVEALPPRSRWEPRLANAGDAPARVPVTIHVRRRSMSRQKEVAHV